MSDKILFLKNKFINLFTRINSMLSSSSDAIDTQKSWHWRKVFAIWMCIWLILLFMSNNLGFLHCIGQAMLAIHLTIFVRWTIKTAAPKTLIRHVGGKAVVITGCDSGFGYGLATELDKLGFKVFAGCLFPAGSGAIQLQENTSERLEIIGLDVTDDASMDRAYETVNKYCRESTDTLWALVNNAGIAVVSEVEWCSLEYYQKLMDVNALGVVRTTKAFLPLLRKNKTGRIVILASLAGRFSLPGYSAYSMSKHAVISFADGLRLEMKKWNITVHTVEPGLYRTSIFENGINSMDEIWEKSPEEIKVSYGKDYFADFKKGMIDHQSCRAKPQKKIHEVIDILVHSVADEYPECRYVPDLIREVRSNLLQLLPTELLDEWLQKFAFFTELSPADKWIA